jgi:hypothetical protein
VTALVWSTDLPLRTMLIGFISPTEVLSIERIHVHLCFLYGECSNKRRASPLYQEQSTVPRAVHCAKSSPLCQEQSTVPRAVHCAKSPLLPEMADGGRRTADSGRWTAPTASVHCRCSSIGMLVLVVARCHYLILSSRGEAVEVVPTSDASRRFKISFSSPPTLLWLSLFPIINVAHLLFFNNTS